MFLPFQDSCAKMLLFRGADKECLNFAGQTAYQVQQIVFRHVTRVTRDTRHVRRVTLPAGGAIL